MPRVGALGRRKPLYIPAVSGNLNLAANKKIGGLSEDNIAAMREWN
jgi:hypothetical protein